MKNQDFTTSFTVDHSPEEAFEAINNVRGWWSGEVAGETSKRSMTAMALPLHSARNTACGSEAMPAKKAAISGPWSAARPVRGAQAQPGVKVGVSYRSYLNGCIHRVTVSSRETS